MTSMTLVTVIAVVMAWRQRAQVTFAREQVTLLSRQAAVKEETCAISRRTTWSSGRARPEWHSPTR
jgi:hypothetical protein